MNKYHLVMLAAIGIMIIIVTMGISAAQADARVHPQSGFRAEVAQIIKAGGLDSVALPPIRSITISRSGLTAPGQWFWTRSAAINSATTQPICGASGQSWSSLPGPASRSNLIRAGCSPARNTDGEGRDTTVSSRA